MVVVPMNFVKSQQRLLFLVKLMVLLILNKVIPSVLPLFMVLERFVIFIFV